jgi:hypothetical protein
MLTPLSASSESRNASPMTPIDAHKSPHLRAPGPRPLMEQPESLKSNADSAFPIFPGPKKDTHQGYAELDPRYAPASPRNFDNGGLLKRLNTIAPGPFDVRKTRAQQDQPRRLEEPAALPHNSSAALERQRGHITQPSNINLQPAENGKQSNTYTISVPSSQRPGGYGGFGDAHDREPTSRDMLGAGMRSNTLPNLSQHNSAVAGLPRRPSEGASRLQRPSNVASDDNELDGNTFIRTSPPRDPKYKRPSMGGKPPPRGTSFSARKNSTAINLAAEFGVNNPYHTPNLSQSSNDSQSVTSKTSSRSSPPSSGETRLSRRPSETAKFDGLVNDLQAVIAAPNKQHDMPKTQFARGMAPPNLHPSLVSPESPMDPGLRGNRLSPAPPRTPPPDVQLPIQKPSPPRVPQEHTNAANLSGFQGRRPSAARPVTAKGDCKGCGEPIVGKSVSSADGRLTGRYHKSCFVCKTCKEPFATATFYVLNNSPYCERHYHKLNNSCCFACDRGIEGQYLETERKMKFHPACLKCLDCKTVLRDDYWEMNGRVYCERDAWRRAQMRSRGGGMGGNLGVGTNRMERRTTRLMMM